MELDLDRLRALRVIGRGAMGTVFLVTRRCSDCDGDDPHSSLPPLFALKVVDKHSPSAKPDADRRARWELNLLSRLTSAAGDGPGHPFLPSLLGSVETRELLAWAVPFCPGGDLHALRHSLSPDAAFSPAAIRFYLSELVDALGHLHSLRVAYRDLKPENILLQSSGHVTLTDFDLSRHLPPSTTSPSSASSSASPVPPHPHDSRSRRRHRRHLTRIFALGGAASPAEADHHYHYHLKKARSARVSPVSRRRPSFSCPPAGGDRSFSFVGTEEYVSPEVVRGEGHGFAVDWWALGVLAYEMSYGRTPFKGRNRKETFRNVLSRSPEFAGNRRCALTDLIERLLAKDPARRLGSAGGADEVRAHPFFGGVQWDLLSDVTRPPFLPPPLDDLEEAVTTALAEDGGFDVRDYFKRLRQPPSPLGSSSSLTEF
ncbi:serine/threonine-protein kinase UCN-like [Canna indica]|uniref:non-specific serine/threonine protein kinase n=1 Tax=Canna indica TaxID=4628 RepID=A0AAQ3JVA8_9LILI|nr:serine/threonine-protein kinase UCN-like [Canna indica]